MKKVLVVGGGGKAPPADSATLPDAVKEKVSSPQGLRSLLGSMIEEAKNKGYEVRMMQLADESKSVEWVEEVSQVLKEAAWDCFIIGNGIRGTPSLTPCFEKLIAAGRKEAPNTPMGFNTHPMDILEAIERVCSG